MSDLTPLVNSRQIDEIIQPNLIAEPTAKPMDEIRSGSGSKSVSPPSDSNGFVTAPATSEDDNMDTDSDDDDDTRSNHSNSINTNINGSGYVKSSTKLDMDGTERGYKRGGGGKRQVHLKGEEKRSHHNVLERKRRDLLKDSFAQLKNSVPAFKKSERVSRAEILIQASDFIQRSLRRNASIQAEIDRLVKENHDLESRGQKLNCDLASFTAETNELKVKQESAEVHSNEP